MGPLTATILGNLKTIILVLAAIAFVDHMELSALNDLGYVIFFLSLFGYSYANYLKNQGKLRYPELPCICGEKKEPPVATTVRPAAEKPGETTKLIGPKG